MEKKDFITLSDFFGSEKRTALLFLVSCGHSDYKSICTGLRVYKYKIISSEIYKHLNELEKLNAVAHKNRRWFITQFGKNALQWWNSKNLKEAI